MISVKGAPKLGEDLSKVEWISQRHDGFMKKNIDGKFDGKDHVASSRDLCGWKSIE